MADFRAPLVSLAEGSDDTSKTPMMSQGHDGGLNSLHPHQRSCAAHETARSSDVDLRTLSSQVNAHRLFEDALLKASFLDVTAKLC